MYNNPNIEIIELDDKQKVIINLMNGCADIIEKDVADAIKNNSIESLSDDIIQLLFEREYIFESDTSYMDSVTSLNKQLIENSRLEAPNFIYIPTFECNLNCYYCFEKAYEKVGNASCGKSVDAFIIFCESRIKELEKDNNIKYDSNDISITITGGEPLLASNYNEITKILAWASKSGYKVGIVTNGTTIKEYLPLFKKYAIDSMQITLDGGKSVHDKIRIGHSGEATYDVIVANIQLVKDYVEHLSIRININKKNIGSVGELENIITRYPSIEFYTYLMQQEGCSGTENIIDEVEGIKKLFACKEKMKNPDNLKIVYHGKKLIETIFNGAPFRPTIKICSAMQNQYIVDYRGLVYKCWWGMGNNSYSIGNINRFGLYTNNNTEQMYKQRNVISIPKCNKCKYRYVCGGGCTGRLTNEQLERQDVICPDFKGVIEFFIKSKIG